MDRENRSVADYNTEEDLRKALMAVRPKTADEERPSFYAENSGQNVQTHNTSLSENMDWVLPSFDPETTEVQSMQEELHRLLVLKSYLILDAEREEAFERITGLCARIFSVPIALVSLVDLGRQWFMSNRGLGNVRETPRKYAFCAHAILLKHNILIVPDTQKDFRFVNNPLVTGPPNIRFYAGAPLVSPEGYKLGTLCIIDNKTRYAGLSLDEQTTLRDLADMVVKELVDRRTKVNLQSQQNPTQLIAYTAHDLLTPLTGVQLSLSLLKEDSDLLSKVDMQQKELLTTASNCSDLMIRICQTAIEALRPEATALSTDIVKSIPSTLVTRISELIKGLAMITEPLHKRVPLVITRDDNIPATILCDDLKLFRSSLNLLSNALNRTSLGYVHLRIYATANNTKVMFQCEDTGPNINLRDYPLLFTPGHCVDGELRLDLSALAMLIKSIDGEYGFRPRFPVEVVSSSCMDKDRKTGSIFWFSVPLLTPKSYGVSQDGSPATLLPKKAQTLADECKYSSGTLLPVNTAATMADMSSKTQMRRTCGENGGDDGIGSRVLKLPTVSELSGSLMTTLDMTAAKQYMSEPTEYGYRVQRALVVDDSIVVRKSIASALSKQGYEVTQALNGHEGLNAMKNTLFDVVFLDFLMPVMDGLDCVYQYRDWEVKNRPWFSQYIVGISAHASAEDGNKGILAGMNDFKAKPLSIALIEQIHQSEIVQLKTRELNKIGKIIQKQDSRDDLTLSMTKIDRSSSTEEKSNKEQDNKRMRIACSVTTISSNDSKMVCLVASSRTAANSQSEALGKLERCGWKVVVVNDGNDALRLLQMRNWDAVLIDDDLPVMSGCECIRAFRLWEDEKRVNKQKHTFILCEGEIPSPFDELSIVQPPIGFDGALRRPVRWEELETALRHLAKDEEMEIVMSA